MNENHAKFFRELRELLGSHGVQISTDSMMTFSFHVKGPKAKWESYQVCEMSPRTEYFHGEYFLPIDAAQKEAEK